MTMCNNCAIFGVFVMCIVFAVSSDTTTDTSSRNCSQKATWTVFMDFAAEAIEKAKNSTITLHDTAGKCGQKEELMSYLEVAQEMIKKAKINFPTNDWNNLPHHPSWKLNCGNSTNTSKDAGNSEGDDNTLAQPTDIRSIRNLDCSDLLRKGHRSSGVYTISPRLTKEATLNVYCDMITNGGGWTVIQRRGDYQNPVDYFFKDWKSYKEGFGDLEKEFWLGNDNVFALTNQDVYSARFDMMDHNYVQASAHYDAFWIDDESCKYTLHISNYSGIAGDSMRDHNNQKFTTKDQDNDDNALNCAEVYRGAWWFKDCFEAHLNGENLKGDQGIISRGKVWRQWTDQPLARTEIKIRPKNFRP